VRARIDENAVKMEKLWLKHDFRGLFVEDLKLEELWIRKLRARI
jgi:hypothetical protein